MRGTTPLDIIVNSIAGIAFLGYLSFIIIYASFANWQATPAGRALMYAIGSLNLVVLLNTVHLFTGPYDGQVFVRMPVYTLLAFSAWHLVKTLVVTIVGGYPITVETFYQEREKKKTTMKDYFVKAQGYAKFLVAMLGALLGAGSLLIPDDWGKWVTLSIAMLTAFSVYQIPNKTVETAGEAVIPFSK